AITELLRSTLNHPKRNAAHDYQETEKPPPHSDGDTGDVHIIPFLVVAAWPPFQGPCKPVGACLHWLSFPNTPCHDLGLQCATPCEHRGLPGPYACRVQPTLHNRSSRPQVA